MATALQQYHFVMQDLKLDIRPNATLYIKETE